MNMIKSMTGFGKMQKSFEKRNISMEIKAVNSRYTDISVRLSRKYNYLEEMIRAQIKEKVKRGKIDVFVNIESIYGNDVEVEINKQLVEEYLKNIEEIKEATSILEDISIEFLLQLPEVINIKPKEESEEEINNESRIVLREALENFDKMRAIEGEKLVADIVMRLEIIEKNLIAIDEKSELIGDIYREKLKNRIDDILSNNLEISEDRLAQEVVFFADKANITEEIVRLKSHIDQMKRVLNGKVSEGRKLDFILQEMNREANTIGSKANDLEITNNMLNIKSEIEKIREQVQNIE